MKSYNIDRLSKEELFGGKVIVAYRQWLKSHNIETKGHDYLYNAVAKLLRLTNDDNLIVTHIMKNTPENSVVFLTGVGKAFPFVRSHNVLNNLHQVLDKVPVVMFYPGRWNGQTLELFGTIDDGNYYRAFPLIN